MSGWRGAIWYGGRGVAVLYSVVVGAVREFWVKTATADVKVHEIPLEIEFTSGWVCVGGVCEFSETEGVYATQAECESARIPIYGPPTPPQTTFTGGQGPEASYDVSIGLSNGGSAFGRFRGPILDFRITDGSDFLIRRPQAYATGVNNGSSCTTFAQFNGQHGWRTFPSASFIANNSVSITSISIVHVASCPGADSTENSPGIPGEIIGYTCGEPPPPPEPVPNPYESFTSALRPKVFALIKSGDGTGSNFELLAYKQLIGETVSDLGSTASGDDWRGAAVSLIPTASITNADSCIETYLDTEDGALIDGTLYRIALDQTISGSTLRSRLQTSSDTVAANLTTQSATSGASCTLDTATTSTVQVPSPGRGTIEGITYLP